MPSGPPLGDNIPGGSTVRLQRLPLRKALIPQPGTIVIGKSGVAELEGMTALGCTPVPNQVDWIWDTEAK